MPSWVRLKIVRSTQNKFTVSVAAIITDAEEKVLLLDHVLRPGSGWGIPGGFIEHGEQPEAAIRREIREETGLELENIKMVRVRTIGPHVEILFRAEARGEARVKSREIKTVGWFNRDELPEKMNRVQKSLVREVFSGKV
jgi:8-oxo-dGTP diphosphatase